MSDPLIIVEDLHKRFGRHEVLRGIDFTVAKGETLVLLGRSGTGKSVTLKALIGLLSPTSGRALVDGEQLADLPERQQLKKRSRIGYVFQGGALFDSLSILENVGFPLYQKRLPVDEIRKRVSERLRMVGLGHTLDQYPSDLSGGMQKRASLARAIIDLPDIVFYDEPTSGLDPLTTDVINQIILRLRSALGVTSIVVTHDIKSAFTIADRIVMLDQGKVVLTGTPEQIADSELPWVQHFIRGEALEGEVIATAAFRTGGTGQLSRSQMLSGRRIAVRQESGTFNIPAAEQVSGPRDVPKPIRQSKSGRMQAVRSESDRMQAARSESDS